MTAQPRPCAGIEQREVLAAQPQWGEVAVVRARRVARLAGGVDGPRIVPGADIEHDPKRWAGILAKVVRIESRQVDGVTAALLRHRPDIQSRGGRRVGGIRQRMGKEGMVQFSPLPLCRVRAAQLLHVEPRKDQTSFEHIVALLHGILAESRFRLLERANSCSSSADRIKAAAGPDKTASLKSHPVPRPPDLEQSGRRGVCTDEEIPFDQQARRRPRARVSACKDFSSTCKRRAGTE